MKQILVLIYPGCAEFELTVATEALRETHRIVTVAPAAGPLTAESGLQLLPHVTLASVSAEEFEGIIIPGGTDMFVVKDCQPLLRLVRTMYERGLLVAAISGGPYVLAQAGILNEVTYATSFLREHRDFLGGFNEDNYRDSPLVKSGNVITAKAWAYAEFGLLVAERLGVSVSENTARFYLGGHQRFGTDLVRGLRCVPTDTLPT
jgi:protein deglycase